MLNWKVLKILIVEDEGLLREVLQGLVENKGATVLGAENGLKALEVLEKEKIDVVIADYMMPKLDGLALLELIRQNHPEFPVFFLATGNSDLSEEDAISKGAAGVVHKPFRAVELFKFLEKKLVLKFPNLKVE